MKKLKFLLLILLFHFIGTNIAFSQCAMCKAVAEGQADQSQNFGEQLNIGIIFLMAVPYLFILIIPLIIFRKQLGAFIREMRGIYKD